MGVSLVDSQVYDNVRVKVTFHTMVSVSDNLLPDLAISHFGAQCSPVLSAKGLFSLVWIEFYDGVEDGEIERPYFDPSGAGRPGNRCGIGRIIGVGG